MKKQTTTQNLGPNVAKLIRKVNDPVMVRILQPDGWKDHGIFPRELSLLNKYRMRIKRETVKTLKELVS